MDTLRGNFGETGYDDGLDDWQRDWDSGEDDTGLQVPPAAIGTDERRMQVRAYNHWASLLDERNFPSIEDLSPENLPDFGPYSVLLDFTSGVENPAIRYLGDQLAEECGTHDDIGTLSDIPSRSLLTRITDHYMQILANQAPIGFEAEFVNQRGATILYRGILLPFSSDDEGIDFIYGVINWKEMADQMTTDELLLEIDQALEADDEDEDELEAREPDPVTQWADSPSSVPMAPADEPAASNVLDLGELGELDADEEEDEDGADSGDYPMPSFGFSANFSIVDPADADEFDDEDTGDFEDDSAEVGYASMIPTFGKANKTPIDLDALASMAVSAEIESADSHDDDAAAYETADPAAFSYTGRGAGFAADFAADDEPSEPEVAVEQPSWTDHAPQPVFSTDPATAYSQNDEADAAEIHAAGADESDSIVEDSGVETALDLLDDSDLDPALDTALDTALDSGLDEGLYDCLAAARELAHAARSCEDRSRSALYAAVGRAYDFSIVAQDEQDNFDELIAENGLTVQDRAPMTPVVKLVFGADYDKTRLTEYAAVLTHAHRMGVERGALAGFLMQAEGGLKGVVQAERRLRREENSETAEANEGPQEKLARKLRAIEPISLADLDSDGAEFGLVMIRRLPTGEVVVLGEITDDIPMVERAGRKLVG
ncbi:hypothetical protein GRI44_11075 [Altererythrobacter confluentis]|uniref:PAS domain-containing protein n=1 Tax=Allopontixanthobacter confluentis TaxID=1849021 RepID=A0A6L7GKU4_9SPHN|nr:hypothetical protein [Allopontixanthobacter confluentis]